MKKKQTMAIVAAVVTLVIIAGVFMAVRSGGNKMGQVAAKYPFPQHDALNQYAVKPLAPQNKTQEEVDDMMIGLFRQFLLEDMIVDKSGPQDKEGFRMVIRHSLGWELAEGEIEWCHINVSESQGYGMVMMAYMAGSEEKLALGPQNWIFGSTGLKDYYDAMLRTVMEYPSVIGNKLFAWELCGYMDDPSKPFGYIVEDGVKKAPFTPLEDSDSATDGDMDIIYSLLLADKQWGSNGKYNYKQTALDMLADLWDYCVHDTYHTLLLGDWVKGSDSPALQEATRPSDFMLSHLKVFQAVDPAHDWQAVIDATYEVIGEIRESEEALGHNNGLLPDFVVRSADGGWEVAPADLLEGSDDTFAYNACRVPWRLGIDYMLFGEQDLQGISLKDDIMKPMADFAAGKGAENLGPVELDGTGGSEGDLFDWTEPDLFAAPFLVPAVAVQDQALTDQLYQGWTTWKDMGDDDWQPFEVGVSHYDGDTYGDYIQLLTLVAASGNWWLPIE